MIDGTRIFYVTDSMEANEELHETLEAAHTLFVQMDKEQICSVILDGNTYWTERPSIYSDGLSTIAHKQLAKIMDELYQAKYLYQ